MSAQWWKIIFLGNAMDVELDSTGRVLVSPELRAAAGIEALQLELSGLGRRIEAQRDRPPGQIDHPDRLSGPQHG